MSEINADHYSNYRTACTTTFMHKHYHNRFLLVIFSFSDHYFLFGICIAVQFGWRISQSTTA